MVLHLIHLTMINWLWIRDVVLDRRIRPTGREHLHGGAWWCGLLLPFLRVWGEGLYAVEELCHSPTNRIKEEGNLMQNYDDSFISIFCKIAHISSQYYLRYSLQYNIQYNTTFPNYFLKNFFFKIWSHYALWEYTDINFNNWGEHR